MKKICKICSAEFESSRKNKNYCHEECAEKARKIYNKKYVSGKIKTLCRQCGRMFKRGKSNIARVLCDTCMAEARERSKLTHKCAECRHAYPNVCVKIKTGGKILYKDTKFSKGYNKLLIHECPNFLKDTRKFAKDKQEIDIKTNELMGVNDDSL